MHGPRLARITSAAATLPRLNEWSSRVIPSRGPKYITDALDHSSDSSSSDISRRCPQFSTGRLLCASCKRLILPCPTDKFIRIPVVYLIPPCPAEFFQLTVVCCPLHCISRHLPSMRFLTFSTVSLPHFSVADRILQPPSALRAHLRPTRLGSSHASSSMSPPSTKRHCSRCSSCALIHIRS